MTAQEILKNNTHIKTVSIAKASGVSVGVLRHYYCGSKKASPAQTEKIKTGINSIIKELVKINYNDALSITHAVNT